MSVRPRAQGWRRRSLVGVLGLVVLAPAFAWAAGRVGYTEPMTSAMELAGAREAPTAVSLFSEYALPGLGQYAGTLGGALVGTAVTLGIALAVGRLLARGN
jgi:hypothetical protein